MDIRGGGPHGLPSGTCLGPINIPRRTQGLHDRVRKVCDWYRLLARKACFGARPGPKHVVDLAPAENQGGCKCELAAGSFLRIALAAKGLRHPGDCLL